MEEENQSSPVASVAFVTAEMEFFAYIQERIDSDEDNYIPMDEVEEIYASKLTEHNVTDMVIDRKHLKANIESSLRNVTRPPQQNKCAEMHSNKAAKRAIQAEMKHQKEGDFKTIFSCASLIWEKNNSV